MGAGRACNVLRIVTLQARVSEHVERPLSGLDFESKSD
jgi:hypothetical protein